MLELDERVERAAILPAFAKGFRALFDPNISGSAVLTPSSSTSGGAWGRCRPPRRLRNGEGCQ